MLKAGFARLDITPPLGCLIDGYFIKRVADHLLDPLEVTAIAVSDENKTAVMITVDSCGIVYSELKKVRQDISKRCNIPMSSVIICCTHIHTGPAVSTRSMWPEDSDYSAILYRKISDSALLAVNDMKPSALRIGRSEAKGISFIRRFVMKDGTTMTNPLPHDPNIDHPIGEPDESVQVVRFVREDAKDIVLVNFQCHPDVIDGTGISADWPGFCRRTLEAACGDIQVAFFNGAQGDTNHHDLDAPDWYQAYGYSHARHMGRVVAGAVLQVLEKCMPLENTGVDYLTETVSIPLNIPDSSEVPWAEHVMWLDSVGRQAELHTGPMASETAMGRALRILQLKDSPANMTMELTAIRIGSLCITGAPGEPFTWIGTTIKEASPFAMTIYCCCCNGYEGYFPVRSAYEEGGYESAVSCFLPGVAELIADGGKTLVKDIYSKQ